MKSMGLVHMRSDELNKRIERTLKRNRALIEQAQRRGERLDRAAARSVRVIDRAMRHLRQGSAG